MPVLFSTELGLRSVRPLQRHASGCGLFGRCLGTLELSFCPGIHGPVTQVTLTQLDVPPTRPTPILEGCALLRHVGHVGK